MSERKKDHCIFPFLWMRGESEDVLRTELEKIHACGITGVCLESRPHPDFLGPGWWRDLDIVMEEAARLDLQVWILDDAHFPTGYANGAVREHPELSKTYLACSFADVVGPVPRAELNCGAMMSKEFTWQDIGRQVKPPLLEETRLISVTARRFAGGTALSEECLDLTAQVGTDGTLCCDIPAGQWRVSVCYTTRADGGDPEYLNPLDAQAVRLLLDTVYEPHYTRYGNRLAGFFSDEPCMGNLPGFDGDAAVGRKRMNLPWCAELLPQMEHRLGAAWPTLLPLLWADCSDARLAARVRLCYMDSVTRLYSKNFSGQLGHWCEERGLEYIGHVVEDGGVHSRLGCGAGHYFRAIAGQHMAGIDVIGGQVTRGGGTQTRYGFGIAEGEFFHHGLVPMGASAAMLDPKKQGRLMCELYGAYGWTTGVRDMKWITDFLISHGVNRLVPHAFSMKEYPDPDCPPHFYARGHNAQFKHFGDLMRYADRLCRRFSGGVGGAKTAILYPAECDWMNPCMPFEHIGRMLDREQVDFWVLPEDALDPGALPKEVEIRQLIVPETGFLSARAARALARDPELVTFVNRRPEAIPDADPEEEHRLLERLSAAPVCPPERLGGRCRKLGLAAGIVEPAFEQLHIYRYFKNGVWDYMVFNESADRSFCGAVTFPDGWQARLTLSPYDSAVFHDRKLVEAPSVPPMEHAERLSLDEGWRLTLQNGESMDLGAPIPVSMLRPRYSGLMCYERTVELSKTPDRAVLEAQWLYETADVYVNGRLTATRLTPPYRFDLSGALHAGENLIRVEVAAPPARDALNYDAGPFGPRRSILEPTGMFGRVQLEYKNQSEEELQWDSPCE